MKINQKIKKTDFRFTLIIVPIVIALTAGFYILAGNAILNLSKEKMTSKSENFTQYINTWAERILDELEIYRIAIKKEGELNEHTFEILDSSYGPHSEYPYGLYWGNRYGDFYDASGWDPGPDYIPSSRNWYIEGLTHTKFDFGEPYIDARTGRPCVSVTTALYYGKKQSVLAADIYFDYAEALLNRLSAQGFEHVLFVSYENRMIITDSDKTQTGTVLDENSPSELYRGISKLLDRNLVGLTKLTGEETYYVNVSKISGANWYLVTCMKPGTMIRNVHQVNFLILLVGVLGCLMLIYLTNLASKEFVKADKEAKTDILTGLYNRNGFTGLVTAALKAAPKQDVLLMLDVDNFKAINDTLGHPIGDEFLKSFAKLLTGYFNRNGDICARLGGDEFAVYVGRNIDADDVCFMLETFLRIFHETYDEKYPNLHLSVSIGAAFTGNTATGFDEIYHNADEALYQAKNGGKDRYVIH